MPEVPEPLPTPGSLGGLLKHMPVSEDSIQEKTESGRGLAALSERTADMTEDIEEYAEVAQAIQAVEAEEAEQSDVAVEATETEEDTV